MVQTCPRVKLGFALEVKDSEKNRGHSQTSPTIYSIAIPQRSTEQ